MGTRDRPHPRSPVQPGGNPWGCLPVAALSAILAVIVWGWLNLRWDEPISPRDISPPIKSPVVDPKLSSQPAQGRGPLGGIAGLIRAEDYPRDALDRGEQGVTTVRLTVGTDGRVSKCTIDRSSGYRSLDDTSCRIMKGRALFSPATDANGRPVEGAFTQRIRWQLEG